MSDNSTTPSTVALPPRRPLVRPRMVDRDTFAPTQPTLQPGEYPALRPYQQGPKPSDAEVAYIPEADAGMVFRLGVAMIDPRAWSVDWRTNPILALLHRRAYRARWGTLVLVVAPLIALFAFDAFVAWRVLKLPFWGIMLLPWWFGGGALVAMATTMVLVAAAVRWNLGMLPLDELRVTALRTEHIVQAMVLPPLATANATMLVYTMAHGATMACIDYYWNGSSVAFLAGVVRVVCMIWLMPSLLAHTAAMALRAHLFLRVGVIAALRAILDSLQANIVGFGAFLLALVACASVFVVLGFLGGFFGVLSGYILLPFMLAVLVWVSLWSARLLRSDTGFALEFCWNERDDWWTSVGPPRDDHAGIMAAPRRVAQVGELPIHEKPERGFLTPWRTTSTLE